MKKYNIYLISDEIYSAITFDPYVSFGKYFEEIKEQLIIISGFSKSHSMTGYRLGFVLLNKDLQLQVKKLVNILLLAPLHYHSMQPSRALTKISTLQNVRKYAKKIEYFCKELEKNRI